MAVAAAVSSPLVMAASSSSTSGISDATITSDQLLPLEKGLAVSSIYLGNVGDLINLSVSKNNFDAVVFNSLRDPKKKVQITVAPEEGSGTPDII